MMRAYFEKRPDLLISILFHLLVFSGLLAFFFIKSCSKEKAVYVFEMVETIEESNVSPKVQSSLKPKPSISRKQEMTAIKRMDYGQFLKENPKSKPSPSVTSTQKIVKPFPKFQLEAEPQTEVKPSQSVDASILQSYVSYVYQILNSQWNKQSANLGKNLSVKVQFLVLADGRIQSAKVIKSSGNQIFDNSILSVFKTIAQFKPTPSGKKKTFVMNFKLGN
jgi:TonB family protein